MVPADDELPPEVQAQVDKAKADDGGDQPAPEPDLPQVEVEVAPKPLSRRQQAEQERTEQIRASEERAAKAVEIAERLTQQRAEDAQRMARMEEMLYRGQQQQAPQQQAAEPEKDWRKSAEKARRKAEKALAENDLSTYHDELSRAIRLELRAEFNPRLNEMNQRAQRAQPPQQQLPDWIAAIEAQHPDVIMHPQGRNTAIALANIESMKAGRVPDAQILMAAFGRAREELGLSRAASPPITEQRRQAVNGGPVNGSGRAAPAGNNGAAKVRVPANYKEIARAAGMSPEAYLRNAKLMESGGQ